MEGVVGFVWIHTHPCEMHLYEMSSHSLWSFALSVVALASPFYDGREFDTLNANAAETAYSWVWEDGQLSHFDFAVGS